MVDIFIPTKRDRSGKRFGFVRFKGVEGCMERLEKLNKIWVDSFVIRAFIPRFTRLMGDRRNEEKQLRRREVLEQTRGVVSRKAEEGTSFAMVLVVVWRRR